MRMDILIVEDQRRIAEGLSVMLSSCKEDGIQIERTLIADNGVQALKMLEQQPVDLLITDIQLVFLKYLYLSSNTSYHPVRHTYPFKHPTSFLLVNTFYIFAKFALC